MKSADNSIMTAPFTKEQARRARNQYRHLEGQEYLEDGVGRGTIECVAVTPYDDVNKYIFLEYYLDCRDPLKALEYYYAPFYDIALVVKNYSDQKLSLKSAVNYAADKEMQQ